MRKFLFVLVSLFLTQFLYGSGFYQEKKSEVKIFWEMGALQFPDYLKKPHEVFQKPLETKLLKPSIAIVLKFLQKYPDALLKKSLSAVQLLGELTYQDLPYKGFFFNKNLYVIYNSVQKSDDYRTFETALHYYYCHLLFEIYREQFDLKEWNTLNPKGFTYQKDHQELHNLQNVPVNPSMKPYSGEFLYDSSAHSIEEDFAGIAKNLFLADPHFWTMIKENQILEKKTDQAIRFLNSLNPQFTKAYFMNISLY